jgi:hypothetical protein
VSRRAKAVATKANSTATTPPRMAALRHKIKSYKGQKKLRPTTAKGKIKS